MKNKLSFKSRILSLFFVAIACQQGLAQDIHFSQYLASPLDVNPALAGQFDGCFRLGGIYRSQWASVMGDDAFKTTSASFDAGILKEQLKGSFVGVGAHFFQDGAGTVRFNTTSVGGAVSYCQVLNAKRPTTISGGLSFNQYTRSIYFNKLSLEDPTEAVGISGGSSFIDIGAGLFYYMQPYEKMSYNVGLSFFHVNRPDQSFYIKSDRLASKINFHASSDIKLSDVFKIYPGGMISWEGGARQVVLYELNRLAVSDNLKAQAAIFFGVGTRITRPGADAAIFYFRYELYKLSIGLSYDVNISGLRRFSKYEGGPELALTYVIPCAKSNANNWQLKNRTKTYCPKF